MAYPYGYRLYYPSSAAPYWTAQTLQSGTTIDTGTDSAFGFSRASLIWTRTTPAGTRIDNVQIDFSIALDTGASFISSLAAGDMANAEGDLTTYWNGLKNYVHPNYTLKEIQWRHLQGYGTKLTPLARVTAIGTPGIDATNRLPDQDSCTQSFLTASRRHWGRVYVPGLCADCLATGTGRFVPAFVDNMVGYVDTLGSNLAGHGSSLLLGVGSVKHYGFLLAHQMEVDDVPDIQRRRRANQKSYAKYKP